MIIAKNEKYTLITSESDSYSEFINSFSTEYQKLKGTNIALQLSENLNITQEEISLFLDYAKQSKTDSASFVIVKSGINIDDFDENLNIVPTLVEAEDVIEMEEIERDLGF